MLCLVRSLELTYRHQALTRTGMSDPDFSPPAPQPPPPQTTAEQRQMEQDEMYARQLAQHYQTDPRSGRGAHNPPLPARPQSDRDRLYGGEERERNFFDGTVPYCCGGEHA